MQIDVAELKRHVGGEAFFEFTQEVEPLCVNGESITFDPARVRLKLINSGESITGFFEIACTAHLECSLCLEPYAEPIATEFQVIYQENGAGDSEEADSEDIVIYEKDMIDVSEDVRQQVVLALPMKPVCNPDCKGLCTRCGQNLNVAACRCSEESPDTRWAVLSDLIKKD